MCVFMLLAAFVSFGSAAEKGKQPKFYYSSYGAKALSESQTVCVLDESGKYLEPRLKYLFTYDENDRVIKKEALRWNVFENDWVNSFCLTFAYDDDSMITEFAKWNKREKNYDECTEKIVYKMNANLFASYSYYKRNLPDDDWTLEHNYLVNNQVGPFWYDNDALIAETVK